MLVITSRQNTKIKALIKIRENPGEELLIEGQHLIEMALESGLVLELFGLKKFQKNETTLISKEVAEKLSSKVSSDGYFAHIKKPNLTLDYTKHLLYLDDVNDPGNMGTLLRSALAFNFGGVVVSPRSVHLFNSKVLSSAQGAHFRLPLMVSDLNTPFLHGKDYKIVATALTDSINLADLKPDKYVLILGNEARGVKNEVLKKSDFIVRIPIKNIDSLNVSVAGGILMYSLSQL